MILLLWNNSSYAEIRDYMNARAVPLLGVEILTPDVAASAQKLPRLPPPGEHSMRELLRASSALQLPSNR